MDLLIVQIGDETVSEGKIYKILINYVVRNGR